MVEAVEKRMLRVGDLVSADGAEVLLTAARRGVESLAIDLDLVREDGRSLPMPLVCRRNDTDDGENGLVMGCLNRETEISGADDGTAELRLSRFFQSAPFGIATVASDGTITNVNTAFARMILDGTSGAGYTCGKE